MIKENKRAVKILYIEDDPFDAELILTELKNLQSTYEIKTVDNLTGFVGQLEQFQPDLVLSDFSLNDTDGMEIIGISSKHDPDLPVIIVTGVLSDETAVECIKGGAADYVIKDNTVRLCPAIESALRARAIKVQKDMAERLLEKNEIKYQNLVESMSEGISYLDKDNKIVLINPAGCHILGYKKEDLLGRTFKDFIHTGQLINNKKDLDEMNVTDFSRQEIIIKRGDEKLRNLSVLYNTIDSTDPDMGSYLVFSDFTKLKSIEEELQNRNRFLQNLIDNIPNPIFYKDKEAIYLGCNKAFEDAMGLKREELIGNSVFDIYENDLARLHKQTDDIILEEGGTQVYESQLNHADGHVRDFIYYKAVHFDENSVISGIIGVMLDITERKKIEEQLRQAQKLEAIGQLSGGIAHDFNNILSVINGHSEMALMTLDSTDKIRNDFVSILKAGKRGSNLVRQLLAFSRKQIINPEVLDINHLIHDLTKMMYRLIGEDIKLEVDLEDKPLFIEADPGQIEQILINLIVNARDAINQKIQRTAAQNIQLSTCVTSLDGSATFDHFTASEGKFVTIILKDTGIGMDKETKEKIFEPFYTTKGKAQGTGLGLATVFGIVKQNKGIIAVDSVPGKGTVFKVFWPQTIKKTEMKNYGEVQDAVIRKGNEVVLIVEDDTEVRQLETDVLQSLGYRVIEASNGKEGMDKIKNIKGELDLIISDVIMPEMGGPELAAALRKIKPEVKIIFTSGYTDDQLSKSGVLEEGVNFINKPFNIYTFTGKIREVLEELNHKPT